MSYRLSPGARNRTALECGTWGPAEYQLACGDAVEWLRKVPDASVDLVVTDPPYESLEKHRAVGTTTRLKHSKASSNDWFEIFPNLALKNYSMRCGVC